MNPAKLAATWFGVGYAPIAPGTWGSLAALPFAWGIAWAAGSWALVPAAAALFLLGWAASARLVGAGAASDPGYVVIDEASVLGGDHVLALFARGRESGLGVLAATQELADFDRAAPGLRDQVLGNTAIKLAHRQDVPSSAQTIAQLAGTETAWEETQRVGGPLLGPSAYFMKSPPVQYHDDVAQELVESFAAGEPNDVWPAD